MHGVRRSAYLFLYGRTPCVKIMTTYSAVAWWVNKTGAVVNDPLRLTHTRPVVFTVFTYMMSVPTFQNQSKQNKTWVPSMIHSARFTVHYPLLNFVLFSEILKSGDRRTDLQTTRAKIVITTGPWLWVGLVDQQGLAKGIIGDSSVLFCLIVKIVRTDMTCENSDHYRLCAGQTIGSTFFN